MLKSKFCIICKAPFQSPDGMSYKGGRGFSSGVRQRHAKTCCPEHSKIYLRIKMEITTSMIGRGWKKVGK